MTHRHLTYSSPLTSTTLAILLSFGSLATHGFQSVPEGLEGRWSGAAIENGSLKLLELDFDVENGRLSTVLTLPYDGYNRFSYDFRYRDGHLESGLFGDMRLFVDLEAAELRGTVERDGQSPLTVQLKRVLPLPRPRVVEEEVAFTAGDVKLAGSLLMPDGSGPHPTVAMIGGRGYGERWASWEMAQRLALFGFAALVWDGRGVGASGGNADTVTGEQRVSDVAAAVSYLRTRPEVNSKQLGLFSGSAGGWVAPSILAQDKELAFWVAVTAPAESLADQQGHVVEYKMRWSGKGYTEKEVADAFAYQKQLVELAWKGAPWSAFEALMNSVEGARWQEEVDWPESLSDADLDYFRRRQSFDPVFTLQRVTTPTLLVYGERDYVVPAEVNVAKMKRYLGEAENANVTIVVVAGATHAMGRPAGWRGEGEWPNRFYSPWHRPPAYYESIVGWLQQRTDSR